MKYWDKEFSLPGVKPVLLDPVVWIAIMHKTAEMSATCQHGRLDFTCTIQGWKCHILFFSVFMSAFILLKTTGCINNINNNLKDKIQYMSPALWPGDMTFPVIDLFLVLPCWFPQRSVSHCWIYDITQIACKWLLSANDNSPVQYL